MGKLVKEKIGCWKRMKEKSGAVFWQTTEGSYEIIISPSVENPKRYSINFAHYKGHRFKGNVIGSAKKFENANDFAENWMSEHNTLEKVDKWADSNL